MGLSPLVYWLAHFFAECIVMTMLCAVLCTMSQHWNLFHGASAIKIFICLESFGVGTISFLAFISNFFKSPEASGQIACSGAILSILVFVGAGMKSVSLQAQAAACVFPPFAFQYEILSFFELTDTHVQKVGAFKDTEDRAMRYRARPDLYDFDVKSCHELCSHYKYLGLQLNGRECYCDNDLEHVTMYGSKSCGLTGGNMCNFASLCFFL